MMAVYGSIIISFIALVCAGFLICVIQKRKIRDKKVRQLSGFIKNGIRVFIAKECRALMIFIIIISAFLYFAIGRSMALSFFGGAIFGIAVIIFGAKIILSGMMRIIEAAKSSFKESWGVAWNSGSIIGMTVIGFGLLGSGILYLTLREAELMYGCAFGILLVAFFSRIIGGVYASAADISTNLVAEAVATKYIGYSVGCITSLGVSLLGVYAAVIIAAIVVGTNLPVLPLVLSGAGVMSAILGNLFVRIRGKKKLTQRILSQGMLGAMIIAAIFSFFIIKLITGQFFLFWAFLMGLVSAPCIVLTIERLTSFKHKSCQKIAILAQSGLISNILGGLSVGMRSSVIPTLIISLVVFAVYFFGGIYGIAMAVIGGLSAFGIALTVYSYKTIIDNAYLISRTAAMDEKTSRNIYGLTRINVSPAIIQGGFTVILTVLMPLVLLVGYGLIANLKTIDILNIRTIIGLFLGGLMPFFVSALFISSVSKMVVKILQDLRRRLKTMSRALSLVSGIEFVAKAAIWPIVLSIIVPIAAGFLLGKESLGGLLIGSIMTGFLFAIILYNSGDIWDNAKRYIEEGNLGGKETEAYKSAVISGTIGNSFRRVAPVLNIFTTLTIIIALIIASLL